MKRVVRKALVVGFAISSWFGVDGAAREVVHEHSYLVHTHPAHDRALLWSTFFQQLDIYNSNNVGGKLQVSSFFHTSLQRSETAQFFGMYNPARDAIEPFVGVAQDRPAELLSSMDIVHDQARADEELTNYGIRDQVYFNPEYRAMGVRFDYVQELPFMGNGAFIRFSVPFVTARSQVYPQSQLEDAHSIDIPGTTRRASLLDYLAGRVENKLDPNLQEPLKRMKMTHNSVEVKGMGDIEVAGRIRIWRRGSSHIDVAAKGIIPTSPDSHNTGEYFFEPRIANGGHYGVGGEIFCDAILWEENHAAIEFIGHLDYTYLFEAKEVRTPLFNSAQGDTPGWAYYQLGGEVGAKGVFPLVNRLTRDYNVTPGHRVQGLAALAVQHSGLIGELGVGAWGTSGESVSIVSWDDGKYALTKWSYDTSLPFTLADAWSSYTGGSNAPEALRTIDAGNINLASITMPSTLAAQLYGAVGYTYMTFSHPLSIGLGATRTFALSNNAVLPAWSAWMKAGLNF